MLKRIRHTTLFLVVVCVFLLIVNVTLGLVLTRQSIETMRTMISSRMLDVSNTAAAMLDGDVLESLTAADINTPEYWSAYKTLSCFEENIGLEYIYCVRDLGDGSFVFLIDPDPETPGAFGEHIVYTEALYQASLGTATVDKVPFEDKWGRFYSAFSPVFDSEGRVAGIVGVDFSADWYEEQASHQLRTTLLISGISLLFAGFTITLVAARAKRRFHQMISAMNVVSDGIETLVHEVSPGIEMNLPKEDSDGRYTDEINELGDKIQSLENRLSEQISFVRSQAYVDGLTGLGNRTAYEDLVKQLDDEIRQGTADFSVALFDMNGLKEINDRLGHTQGDQAIAALAAALKQFFTEEKLFRIGGDEFIVIFAGSPADMQSRLGEVDRLLEQSAGATAAGGCAVFTPGSDSSYREVFMRADNAMYDVKKKYYLNR